MGNRVRKDEDVFDMGRETPEGTERTLIQRLNGAGEGEELSTDELMDLARDTAEAMVDNGHGTLGEADMTFVPAEDIDDALDELFSPEYDHRHDGNAICPSCGGVFVQHYRFLMPCRANDIDKDDLVPVCDPEDYFAFREDDGTLVVESPGGEQWEYCSYEPNDGDILATCSHTPNHAIWNCKPLGKKDPVTEEFMRSISS